jgi:hypothetical protein
MKSGEMNFNRPKPLVSVVTENGSGSVVVVVEFCVNTFWIRRPNGSYLNVDAFSGHCREAAADDSVTPLVNRKTPGSLY